ncbi:MAG TPA: AgmX/PglI C-terminal domain-containing protein [Polyangiaceae bacterium]|nr:AgmX/PglI C-terminal domain-containing protein [Polyangiaceae bacterium]
MKTLHAAHATALAASAAPLTRPGAVAPAKTASPVPSAVDTGSPFMPAASGSGNQADEALGHYIKDVVRKQFSPLLGSCYEDLLRRHPGQAGKVILDVNVVGDPSVGGVVDTVKFAKGSTLDDTEFATCVEQSMLSVAFAAPPKGADSIDFTYPWELAP